MRSRRRLIVMALASVAAACSDPKPETAEPSSTTAVTATTSTVPATGTPTTGAPTTPTTPSTTTARSLGGYNVTPLRSDGQRVTFRLTVPDGATGEVSLAPPDTTISLVEPSIELVRPDGTPAGGGGIFTAATDDAFFVNFCTTALGGNCTPRTTEPLADGNRLETFAPTAGGTISRVVFGPWAMFVQDRDVAHAFTFRSGTDGFPVVAPLAAGYSTKNPYLRVHTATGPRYTLLSDPSGNCAASNPRGRCDRGLSIDAPGATAEPLVERIN